MAELRSHRFEGGDGTVLAYHEMGRGRPAVLLHGLFSSAMVNWVRYGHTAAIAGRGFRVIMPDLRGHGDSAKPHHPAAYPPDVLADDGFALIEHLGLTDYALGGYSLGGRTATRMLARGAAPTRAVIAGMGLDGIVDAAGRDARFRRILSNPGGFAPGSPEWKAELFLKTLDNDPVALLHLLGTMVGTPPGTLARITTPTLVLAGAQDDDTGSAAALAAAMPVGRHAVVPGNHMTAVTGPALGTAIAAFLSGGPQAPAGLSGPGRR